MNIEQELVSVIIPIYNVEQYLDACVKSVLSQTYKNLEIILVDDGAKDSSGMIADKYGKLDSRVQVIHKKNGGLSDARNAGMKLATGKYLFFVDSDDLIPSDAIESLWTVCQKMNTQIAVGGMEKFLDGTTIPDSLSAENPAECLKTVEALRRMLKNEGFGHEAPGKLYIRDLWNEIEFPFGQLYEDYSTVHKVMMKAEQIGILRKTVYCYRTRVGSIMNSCIQEENLELLDIAEQTTADIVKVYPQLWVEAKTLEVVTDLKLMEGILQGGKEKFPEAQSRILHNVKDYAKVLLKSEKVRKIDKLKILSLLIGRNVFMLSYKVGERANRIKAGGKA